MTDPGSTIVPVKTLAYSQISPSSWVTILSTFAVICSLLLVFSTFEIFRFGVWSRAEPMIVGFHAVAGLCSIVLILAAVIERTALTSLITHPIIILIVLTGTWAVIGSIFARHPLMGILGSPQLGQGAIWFYNLAVIVACGLLVSRSEIAWRILVIIACLVVLAVIVLRLTEIRPGANFFLPVNDFLAYFAIALPIISLHHTDGKWGWLFAIGVMLGIGVMAASDNAAAAIAAISVTGLLSGMYLVGLLTSAKLHWLSLILRRRELVAAIVAISAIIPLYFIQSGVLLESSSSLQSRHLIAVVMNAAQQYDVKSLLLGNGWGHVHSVLIENLNASGQNLNSSQWDFLTRDIFHTHNWILESIYTSGLIGAVLVLGTMLCLPIFSPPKRRYFAAGFAATLGALNSVWFQLSFSVPFIGLAMVALVPFRRATHQNTTILIPITIACLSIILLGQISAAFALTKYGVEFTAAAKIYQSSGARSHQQIIPLDFRRAEYALALMARTYFKRIQNLGKKPDADSKEGFIKLTNQLIDELEIRIPVINSSILSLAGVAIFSEGMFDPRLDWLRPTLKKRVDIWERWTGQLLKLAPGRTEMASSFFTWLLINGEFDKLSAQSRIILAERPEDPIALYYLGASLVVDPRRDIKEQGLYYMRKSLDAGVERFVPIDPKLKTQIMSAK